VTLQRSRVSGLRSTGDSKPLELCALSKRVPTLTEFMSLDKWEDGTQRERGTIRLMIEGDVWKACLNDLDGSAYAFLSARTFTALLETIEKALVAQSADWRPSKPLEGRRSKGSGQR
jgi:hypothetical protein